jgi:hypothetical protein
VLVPSERLFRANFVGSLDPVPAAVSVTAQAPGVLQSRLVGSTPAESDHHTRGGACCAKRRRMIGSHTRFFLTCHPQVLPSERCFVHIEAPDIVDRLSSCVATEHEQIGFAENDSVAVSATRGSSDNGNNHPLGCCIAIPQVQEVQVVRGQTTA